jgi:hypothetical protein
MKFSIGGGILRKTGRLLRVRKDDNETTLTFKADLETQSVSVLFFDGIKRVFISFSAEVGQPGEAMILNKYCPLFAYMGEVVTVASYKKGVMLTDGKSSVSIPAVRGHICAAPPSDTHIGTVTADLSEIKKLFMKVLFASGDEEVRYDYRAVLLECGTDYMRTVACDRRIMAMYNIPKESPFTGSFRLPSSGASIVTEAEGDLATLSFYKNAIGISVSGELMIDVYLPEYANSFPDYREVLRRDWKTFLRGPRDEFMAMVEGSALSNELSIIMGFRDYEKQPARFFLKDPSGCSVEHISKLKWSGEDLKIKVNRMSFRNAVKNAEGQIIVGFNNEKSPFSVSSETGDYVCYLMPYSPAEKR